MKVCPDCRSALAEANYAICPGCGWEGSRRGSIELLIGRNDRSDPVLSSYLCNYDQIADDDLADRILEARYVRNMAANLARHLGNLSGLRICDLGSGKGFLAREIVARRPAALTLVDISMAYLDQLATALDARAVIANAENLPFENEFDVVTATDVMEHVLNVGSFLYCVNRALVVGGRFIVRVPYRENLLGYSPHVGCPYRFVHLRTYDRHTLSDALDAAGFHVESVSYDGFVSERVRRLWRNRRTGEIRWPIARLIARLAPQAADVTLLPPWLAGLFMSPLEIVAICHKARQIAALPAGGYELR